FTRGIARIAGTAVGVAIATALVVLLPDTPHVSLAFAVLFVALGYATFQMNYGLYSLNVTAYVVFLLALLGVSEQAAILNRLIATAAGGTLAMVSYLVWPTWESAHTRDRIVGLLQTHRLYTRMLLAGLIDPAQRNVRALSAMRQNVWRARVAAQESLERMLSEPASTHDIDADLAVATMAATRRIGLADLSNSSLYAEDGVPAFPEAEPFARALESAMAGITMAIEHGTPPFASSLLRDTHAELMKTLPADRYGRSTFLANADLLVDGINTIADLWSKRGA
ncbi:MAG TPA: FUSC family protein, partial [Candidatus Baltobacteraceae bacterium]|nr:FUSC family protein [Candidatus Baltobacteraceae bacterium]